MAFGAKTNERPGVRAEARYLRVSAYKARAVLDLIRGESVARAFEILELTDRAVSGEILKCLESAVANAEHNNALPADELYVSACFADEGPTLKRWRPRARGRATRIRKRTCHITIIVSRLAPEDLERLRAHEAGGGRARGNRAAAEARRQRVQRSRQTKADKRAAEEEEHDHDHDDDDHDHDDEAMTVEVEAPADTDTDEPASDEAEVAEAEEAKPAKKAAAKKKAATKKAATKKASAKKEEAPADPDAAEQSGAAEDEQPGSPKAAPSETAQGEES
jgi:large subunit ribosomal protein L22